MAGVNYQVVEPSVQALGPLDEKDRLITAHDEKLNMLKTLEVDVVTPSLDVDELRLSDSPESPADKIDSPASPTNGIPAPSRPAPTAGGSTPSSKPESPYVERSNPMGHGSAQTVSSKDPKAVAQAASDMKNVVRRKLTGYVGFANLPNQWHRKSVRKGFNFNVMVVGK